MGEKLEALLIEKDIKCSIVIGQSIHIPFTPFHILELRDERVRFFESLAILIPQRHSF